MKNIGFALCILFILCGCSTTIPVAVIGYDGRIIPGTNIVSISEGSFLVSDGKITCSGSYNPFQYSITISMPVICSDGRKGIVQAIRDTSTSGSGTFRLNDGYHGDFIFGNSSSKLLNNHFRSVPPPLTSLNIPKENNHSLHQLKKTDEENTFSEQKIINNHNSSLINKKTKENGSGYGEISKITGLPKTIYVRRYCKKNGTCVRGHYRSRR